MNFLDPVLNGVVVTVSTGYDDDDTSVVLESGEGAKLPAPSTDGNFNLVWYNASDYRLPFDDPNVEIIRVTGKSTDTLTVVRPAVGNSYNGEGTANTAKTHNTSGKVYKMILSFTKSQLDKIDEALAAGGGEGFNPTTTVELYEEFTGTIFENSRFFGNLLWFIFRGAGWGALTEPNSVVNRIGVVSIDSGVSAYNGLVLQLLGVQGKALVKGGQTNYSMLFSIANVGNPDGWGHFRAGLMPYNSIYDNPTNGIFFRVYGGENWKAVTRNGGTETSTDTGIAHSTTYKNFKIESNSEGNSIKFYIDGNLVATHTTNITTADLSPSFQSSTNTSTSYSLLVDYMLFRITGLTR